MKNSPELRWLTADELRVDSDGEKPLIRMAIRFNKPSLPLGNAMRFREILAPSAFDSTLNDPNAEVLSFWNHNTGMPLGRRSTGTLRISKTDSAFQAEISPPDTSWGRDAVESLRRGDVQGMSFGFFQPKKDGEVWTRGVDQMPIRTLTNVEIYEVSPTAMPAYPNSSAAFRSVDEVGSDYAAEIEAEQQKQDQHRQLIADAQFADRQRRDRLHRSIRTANSK